ncbi:MAG TPA: AAA family ATPase [Acidimicrobiia bacterium]|nr:AAA family ATPase [Acidimicrobiia bacterium]
MDGSSGLVTILFTDLVGSTELLSRTGDETAQRIFRAHHDLLAEVATEHGGDEVKWLGDGLMVAFPSAAGAVRAALAMQAATRRPVRGEHLAIRVGLNAGEALRDTADFFGLPVVVARRLCDRADAGQILCSDVVAGLLSGRPEFAFRDLGKLDLKGVANAVATFEVHDEDTAFRSLPARMPFVGREAEQARLDQRLAEAAGGHGGVVMVAGEPGLGKTRLSEELARQAARQGCDVLWGHCFDGEWTPPYTPFAEIIEALTLATDADELRLDLGAGGPPLAQLVPAIRKVIPDLAEPVSLQPDEERFRLLDAAVHLLTARSERRPLLVLVEDLHWADRGTVALLRHLARFAARHRLLVVGTFRDAEVDRDHPMSDALGAFPRDTTYDLLRLEGLGAEAIGDLLVAVANQDVNPAIVADFTEETAGNPFFLQEALRHLIEEGKLYRDAEGRWTADQRIRDLGIPESVRAVIGRRLARLSERANRLLAVAATFEGTFRIGIAAEAAELSEMEALDAVDEALAAQLARPGAEADTCTFAHPLVRDTIYEELSGPRRLRLHRRVAEALEAACGPGRSPVQAGEIASQYHRSAGIPGAERGVEPALEAAAYAEANGAHDEAAGFLRMALGLLPEGDPRRPAVMGRLGITLIWARALDEAVAVAAEVGDALAASVGPQAAAAYLSEAAYTCGMVGGSPSAWALAAQGLSYATERDAAWARLVFFDLQRRESENADYPGIPIDTPERHEAARILREAPGDPMGIYVLEAVFSSGAEARMSRNLAIRVSIAGQPAESLDPLQEEAERSLRRGQLVRAARAHSIAAFCLVNLGRLDEARALIDEAMTHFSRAGAAPVVALHAVEQLALAKDEEWPEVAAAFGPMADAIGPATAWAAGLLYSVAGRVEARLGQTESAWRRLKLLLPWLERAPAWSIHYPVMVSHAVDILCFSGRTDHAEVIEDMLQHKVIEPDFRDTMVDGRLALARLCALQGRHDEARQAFAAARPVLTEQGARPLLAITDFDEAAMEAALDAPRARSLVDAARWEFEQIGMTGWLRKANELRSALSSR